MARTSRKAVTFEDVRVLGLRLPDVEESTMYGMPALKLRGKLLACIASHKSSEPNSLVVRIDFDQRDELIAAEPQIYYVTHHYVDYACVVARLARIRTDALEGLLHSAWRFVDAQAPKRVTKRHF